MRLLPCIVIFPVTHYTMRDCAHVVCPCSFTLDAHLGGSLVLAVLGYVVQASLSVQDFNADAAPAGSEARGDEEPGGTGALAGIQHTPAGIPPIQTQLLPSGPCWTFEVHVERRSHGGKHTAESARTVSLDSL